MSLAMCNSKIVCDVICRHFFTFALFPSLGIEKSGVVDFFFHYLYILCTRLKFERNANEDLDHFVQRENVEFHRSMLLLMLLFCN